jgi:carbonic anhydrase
MEKITSGVVHFNESVSAKHQARFAGLAQGQSPSALFITCADSRIDPSLINSTNPGDLFIMRNIGNLIPPYHALHQGEASNSVVAAVEYALSYLNIPTIIVCGHSNCGAMNAVRTFQDLPESHLREWLATAQEALAEAAGGKAPDPALSDQDQLAQLNVLQQITHLKDYPGVKERISEGKLNVYGLYLDIANAEVQVYHPGRNRFVRLTSDVAEELEYLDNLLNAMPEMRLNLHDAGRLLNQQQPTPPSEAA